jgi:hypothetical protein
VLQLLAAARRLLALRHLSLAKRHPLVWLERLE